ncbi:MAG TPA: ABC transporter permease [Lacunisphaera sp.]|nr:ABC transporter permease [Lacunisphaera sp.]
MISDLRQALRSLAKTPGPTAVIVLTLAIGIGGCTSLFSVVSAVLLRPLPFPQPDRLTLIWETNPAQGVKRDGPSGPDFYDWREQGRLHQDLAALELGTGTVTGLGEPRQIPASRVTTNLFTVLDVHPALGRLFTPGDGRGGRQPEVVITDAFWERALGRDPHIIGRTVMIDLIPYKVIGVLEPGFWLPFQSDIFAPWPNDELRYHRGRLAHDLGVIGRLRPGVTPVQAEGELNTIAARLRAAHPELAGWGVTVVPLQAVVVEYIRPALLLLFGAVVFVLLIACANVANLLLARAVDRRREVAVRAALGASHHHLFRLFLTESLVLSLGAGLLGLLFAAWGVSLLSAIVPATIPLPDAGADVALRSFGLDAGVLVFGLVASLLTGLLFGVAPAVHALKVDLIENLKQASRSVVGGGRRLREGLLVAEVALALVLLVGSGLMLRSFSRLLHSDLGLRADHLLTLEMELPTDTRYKSAPEQRAFFDQVLERVSALPGVKRAAVTSVLPLHHQDQRAGFRLENDRSLPADEQLQTDLRQVSPGYFQTMGIALKQGRLLDDRDGLAPGAPLAGLVDEAFVRRFLGKENPLGRRLLLGRNPVEIVGVVGDVKEAGADHAASPTLYLSFLERPAARMNLVLRTATDPLTLVDSAKAAIWSIDREQPIYRIASMEEVVAEATSAPRLTLSLLGAFAGLALGLAVVGIYGVTAYSVSQRTAEFGLRLALGAQPADVVRHILRRGLVLAAAGTLLGAGLALALARLLSGFLFGVSPFDPATFLTVALVLIAIALLACWLPARRATRVDPLVALRAE